MLPAWPVGCASRGRPTPIGSRRSCGGSIRKRTGWGRPGAWSSTDDASANRRRSAPSVRSSRSVRTRRRRSPREPPRGRADREQGEVADEDRDRVGEGAVGRSERAGSDAHGLGDHVARADERAVVERRPDGPFSGQICAQGDTKDRCSETKDRSAGLGDDAARDPDRDRDRDAERDRAPVDPWPRALPLDAASVPPKKKPIREAYADRRDREKGRTKTKTTTTRRLHSTTHFFF